MERKYYGYRTSSFEEIKEKLAKAHTLDEAVKKIIIGGVTGLALGTASILGISIAEHLPFLETLGKYNFINAAGLISGLAISTFKEIRHYLKETKPFKKMYDIAHSQIKAALDITDKETDKFLETHIHTSEVKSNPLFDKISDNPQEATVKEDRYTGFVNEPNNATVTNLANFSGADSIPTDLQVATVEETTKYLNGEKVYGFKYVQTDMEKINISASFTAELVPTNTQGKGYTRARKLR